MISVTKRFRFEAAHNLPEYPGDCAKIHGHSYVLDITFEAPYDHDYQPPIKGMVIDFKDIKEHVGPIVDKLDHTMLNDIFPIPTAERMVKWLVNEIQQTPVGTGLIRVRLWETADSYATWSIYG